MRGVACSAIPGVLPYYLTILLPYYLTVLRSTPGVLAWERARNSAAIFGALVTT